MLSGEDIEYIVEIGDNLVFDRLRSPDWTSNQFRPYFGHIVVRIRPIDRSRLIIQQGEMMDARGKALAWKWPVPESSESKRANRDWDIAVIMFRCWSFSAINKSAYAPAGLQPERLRSLGRHLWTTNLDDIEQLLAYTIWHGGHEHVSESEGMLLTTTAQARSEWVSSRAAAPALKWAAISDRRDEYEGLGGSVKRTHPARHGSTLPLNSPAR